MRRAGSLAAKSGLRLSFFALLAVITVWPLLANAAALSDFRDEHILLHYETTAAMAVRNFAQVPLWDPYYCGGVYLLGTPSARFVSPTFLLTLLFGDARGEALTAFAMVIVALEGAYRYARSRRATHLGALLAAPVFGLSGVFIYAPIWGWINFYGFALLPWIALGTRRALRGSRVGIVVAAVAVAWCMGFGGTYAVPMSALWCILEVVEALVRSARRPRRLLTILGRAALVGALALSLSAVRLWPVFETVRTAPRVIGGAPAFPGIALLQMLFLPIISGSGELADRGTYFIGALALPAVALALWRLRSIPLMVHAAVWTLLAAGYALAPSPYAALRALPVYETLRAPERFLIFVALAASALAACGLTAATALARTRSRGRIASMVMATVAGLALVCGIPVMIAQHYAADTHRDLVAAPAVIDRPFHQARGTRWALAYYAPMNRGSLSCMDAYPVPQSPLLRGDLKTEERLEDETAGTLVERAWSPNRIELDVDLARPARVAINQNWHVGWRSNVGEVASERGLLVVDLPAGHHALTLRFLPRSAVGGLLISCAALVGAAFLLMRKRLSPASLVAIALGPLVVFALSLVLIPQAMAAKEVPTIPSGEPIVADGIGVNPTRFDVALEGGITLEGAFIDESKARAGDTLSIEIDWRRKAKIPRGLGIFVHIEPSSGDALNGDHALLSEVMTFEAAPPEKTLRDVFPLTLPTDANGKTWKVWVGLWRIKDGDRLHVVDQGAATVEDDRILIGTFVAH